MIEPGKVTVELLFDNPVNYVLVTTILALLVGVLSAYAADRLADEAKREQARKENPEADTAQMWDLENGDISSVVAGFLAVVAVVLPLMNIIDQVGGFFGILAAAVGAGMGARKILPTVQNTFTSKIPNETP